MRMPGKALFHSVFAEASALQQCLGRSPLLWRIPDVKPNFSISRIFLEGKKKRHSYKKFWGGQAPQELLCCPQDISCLGCHMLHQKGHFRQLGPVPLPPGPGCSHRHVCSLFMARDGWTLGSRCPGVRKSPFIQPASEASFFLTPPFPQLCLDTNSFCVGIVPSEPGNMHSMRPSLKKTKNFLPIWAPQGWE